MFIQVSQDNIHDYQGAIQFKSRFKELKDV